MMKYVDQESKDVERIWPREMELLKGWKSEEITNTVFVRNVRVMMSGGATAQGKMDSKGSAKSGGRGGKGSKKR